MTQGLKIGQLALLYGANDMGSLMIEENVVAEAGTVHYLTLDEIRGAIAELGFVPRQRNVRYELDRRRARAAGDRGESRAGIKQIRAAPTRSATVPRRPQTLVPLIDRRAATARHRRVKCGAETAACFYGHVFAAPAAVR